MRGSNKFLLTGPLQENYNRKEVSMSKTTLFIRATTKLGKRDELRRLWEYYLKPHIETKTEEESCLYCYAVDAEYAGGRPCGACRF